MVAVFVGCSSEAPRVGFDCGGPFTFHACPPATTCVQEDCKSNDCTSECRATTVCDPENDTCPNGAVCDEATERCVPRKLCARDEDCGAGAFCSAGSDNATFSHAICFRR